MKCSALPAAATLALLAGCGTRDRAPVTPDELTAAQVTAIASAWRSPAMLAVQARGACDTITIGIPRQSCGRGGAMPAADLAMLVDAAASLVARTPSSKTPGLLRSLALVDAATANGDSAALNRAVASIDAAAKDAAPGAEAAAILVDQAALHLHRYALLHDLRDLLAGLDAADGATRRDPENVAACWNRALAVTWLGMRHAAARAWPDCARLSPSTTAPRVADAGSVQPEVAPAVAMTGRWLEATQEYAWTVILPRWGRAVRLAHTDSAAVALRELDSAITLLKRQPRDSSLVRVRRDIQAAGSDTPDQRRLARAFELYGGAKLVNALATRARVPGAVDSALLLTRRDEELTRWARLKRAAGLITSGRSSVALDTLLVLRRAVAGEQSLFAMRVFYDAAVATMARGENQAGRVMFGEVGAQCAALQLERCHASAVGFQLLLAELAGDDAATLQSSLATLTAIAASPASAMHCNAMFLLRRLAVVQGKPAAVALLDAEAGAVAVAIGEPLYSMDGVTVRAGEHIDAADLAALARDLVEARQMLPQVPATDREWYAPELLRMEAELLRGRDARRSVVLLDSALRLVGSEENAVRRGQLVASRARSALAAGDSATALRDLDAVMQLVSARIGTAPSVYERVRLGRVLGDVSRISGGVLRQRGEVRRAYAALSGRPFAGAAVPLAAASGDAHWRAMRQVGDSVWIWSVVRDSLRLRVVHAPAKYAVAAAALDSVALTRLYELLLRDDSAVTTPVPQGLVLDVRGALAAVPWGALYDTARRRYLVELVPIVLTDGSPRGMSVAAPLRPAARPAVLVDAATGTRSAALPGAASEIAVLEGLWQGRAQRVDGRRGAAYTLSRLSGAGTIHFAGHAILDRQLPERSYLALPSQRDSTIAATQILAQSFRGVSLVVLAGCETRGFPLNDLGGFDSLAGAFLSAGASAVIGAGWRVDDASTATLMERLHAALLSGQVPAEALRSAQVAAIRSANPTLRSPRMWAAFQVMGS